MAVSIWEGKKADALIDAILRTQKIDKVQGTANAGKQLIVGSDGIVVPGDVFSSSAKAALLNCLEHVVWADSHGQIYYNELKRLLEINGEPEPSEYIYKLSSPLTVDGSTGYLDTDVKVFSKNESFGALIDFTEGGTDYTVNTLVSETVAIAKNEESNSNFIISSYKSASVQNVNTRLKFCNAEYLCKMPKEQCGNRRIKIGASYDSETNMLVCRISSDGTLLTPSADGTTNPVTFSAIGTNLVLGASYTFADVFKGEISEFNLYNHTLSLEEIEDYITA